MFYNSDLYAEIFFYFRTRTKNIFLKPLQIDGERFTKVSNDLWSKAGVNKLTTNEKIDPKAKNCSRGATWK